MKFCIALIFSFVLITNMCDMNCVCTKMNRSLDKAVSTLEMELTAARTGQTGGQHLRQHAPNHSLKKAFVVIGINTAFSSKSRRDSIRETWLPKGAYFLNLNSDPDLRCLVSQTKGKFIPSMFGSTIC